MINSLCKMDIIVSFIELLPDLAFVKNEEGVYLCCNALFLEYLQKSREEVIGKTNFELFSFEDAQKFNQEDKKVFQENKSFTFNQIVYNKEAQKFYFHTFKQLIYDDKQKPIGIFAIARDITLEQQYKIIYDDNRFLLEYIAVECDLNKSLNKIVLYAQERNENSLCSILLLDKEKKHLLSAAAPSLPKFYNKAMNGIAIGEKVGSCGSASYKQKRVIVENIDTHENWQKYLDITNRANLHACWSEPIFSSTKEILGTFAIYHSQAKKPTNFELQLIQAYAHVASVAIEKNNYENMLKEKEQQLLEETQELNKTLQAREYEISRIFNNALVGLIYVSQERTIIKCNQHLADIFGYDSPLEIQGLDVRKFHLSKKNYREFGKAYFSPLREKEIFNVEYQFRKKDGSALWCELSGKVLDRHLPADLSKGVLMTVQDISSRKNLEIKLQERTKELEQKNRLLEKLASKDYLTNLYNRAKLDETLEYEIKYAKRHNIIFGVIMIDIDFFKTVNDEHGHQVGDTILQEFANLLLLNSRESDIVGRWGGEEFLIIANNITQENIMQVTEKLRFAIEKHPFPIIKNKTASFGVTLYRENDTLTTLIARADEALYQAKNSGRNCAKFF